MAFYLVLSVVYVRRSSACGSGRVARWTGMRFPVAGHRPHRRRSAARRRQFRLRSTAGCSASIILSLILTRVEDADLWPELTLMVGGTLLIWFVAFGVVLALLG